MKEINCTNVSAEYLRIKSSNLDNSEEYNMQEESALQ
jgi:hypothetical protein